MSQLVKSNSILKQQGQNYGPKLAVFTFYNNLIISEAGSANLDQVGVITGTGPALKKEIPALNDQFPYRRGGWILAFDNINSELVKLSQQGYTIVILDSINTNTEDQSIVAQNTILCQLWGFLQNLACQPYIYISVADDEYRLPNLGLWTLFKSESNLNIDLVNSFFCGSMMEGLSGIKEVYSQANRDWLVSKNLGLKAMTPDQIFSMQTNYNLMDADAIIIWAADFSQFRDWLTETLERNQMMTQISRQQVLVQFRWIDTSFSSTMCRTIGLSNDDEEKDKDRRALISAISKRVNKNYRPIIWLQISKDRETYLQLVKDLLGQNILNLYFAQPIYGLTSNNNLGLSNYLISFQPFNFPVTRIN